MLCIVYISKVKLEYGKITIPDFLPDILSKARQNNRSVDITSTLVYREGMFLQMLEGNSRDVDELYQNISKDSRHGQIEKIIDMPVRNRTFDGIDIQLMLNIQEDTRLVNFFAANKEILLSYGHNITEKLKNFGCDDLESLTPFLSEYEADYYNNKSFMLKETVELDWFEIGMLDPEIAITGIALTEKLFRKKHSYRELLESGEFGLAHKLVKLLNTLHTTGSLLIAETHQIQSTLRSNNSQPEQAKLSFGQKMLSWLRKH